MVVERKGISDISSSPTKYNTTHALCFAPPISSHLALRHPREFRIHHDAPRDLLPKYPPRLAQQQVHALQDVDVDLVPLVPDTLPSPVDGSGDLGGEASLVLNYPGLLLPEVNVQLEDVDGGILGVAKVHRLIKELIEESEVVPDLS